MNDNHPPANWSDRAAALGASLATAMIFAASTRGTGLAMALAYFAPLPLMIGAIGFSALGALAGLLLGAILLSHLAQPALGVAFFLAFGAPALIAGALTRRSFATKSGESAPLPRFLQPGALLAILLALSVAVTWTCIALLIQRYHGSDAALAALLERFKEPLDQVVESLKQMSSELDGDTIKRLMILSAPAALAASQTLLLAINLWLAARAVEISGRLGRAWPALPENLVLPRVVAPVFVIACALSFKGGLVGALAGALAAASGLCLAIQGLATLHALSRNAKFRGALLSGLYAVVFVLEPWSILILALFGFVESVFNLRARRARRLHPKILKNGDLK